jgi:TRAP-type mannitol/chloroaromatic compound transport system permease small subunit
MAIANWVGFDDGYLLLKCITLSFGEVVESYLYDYNPQSLQLTQCES